jgi:hypothetical protein
MPSRKEERRPPRLLWQRTFASIEAAIKAGRKRGYSRIWVHGTKGIDFDASSGSRKYVGI